MRELSSLRQISSIDEEVGGPEISLTPKITAFQKSNNPHNPQYALEPSGDSLYIVANLNHTSHSAHFLDVLPDGPAGSWHFRFHQLRNERPQSSVLTHGRIRRNPECRCLSTRCILGGGCLLCLGRGRGDRQDKRIDLVGPQVGKRVVDVAMRGFISAYH